MKKYQSPRPLPDEHMRLVGIISAHWEWVELILERAVAEVMQHQPHRVALLTSSISFHTKCDLLMIYARALEPYDPPGWKEFTAMMVDLKNAYSARNKFIHAKWIMKPPAADPYRIDVVTKGGKLTLIDEPTSTNELAQAAQEIFDAGERLTKWGRDQGILQHPYRA